MPRCRAALFWLLLMASPATLWAQALEAPAAPLRIRPGLWESRLAVETGDPFLDVMLSDAQARIAALPPEQRQQLERAMAANGLALGAQPNSLRACVTPEQAARDELPQQIAACRSLDIRRQGNTVSARFDCQVEPPLQGEGRVTLQSATAYRGEGRVSTVLMGQPRDVTLRYSGRWLGDACPTVAARP